MFEIIRRSGRIRVYWACKRSARVPRAEHRFLFSSPAATQVFAQFFDMADSSVSNPRLLRNLVRLWSNDSLAALIHPHWLQYEQASETFHVLSGVLISLVGFAAICGNGFVIYVFSRTKNLKTKSNTLIVNLAVSDLLMISVLAPMYAISSFSSRWVFGYNGCQFYGFVGALCGTSSIITITAMALDRCFVICKPFQRLKGAIAGRRHFALSFIWIYSFVWAVIPLTPGSAPYVPEGFLTTCSFDLLNPSYANKFYIGSMCVGAYFIPLIIIIVAYIRIITVVILRGTLLHTLHAGRGASISIGRKRRKQQIKSAKVSFFVVAGWTIAWTPYAVVSLLGAFGEISYLTPTVCHLPAIFAKTAAVYNPIIYAFNSPRYRQAFIKIVSSLFGFEGCQRRQRTSGFRSTQSVTTFARPTVGFDRKGSLCNIRGRRRALVRHSTFPLLRLPTSATTSLRLTG